MRSLWLAALVIACSSGQDDASEPSDRLSCAEICARHIDCENDPRPECELACAIARASCSEEADQLAECLLDLSDDDFVCVDGYTEPRDACEAEQDALTVCAGVEF